MTPKDPKTTDTKDAPQTLREQVSDKEAELVVGKPLDTTPPPPPEPPAAVDPQKAAANRKMLLELDAHDVRREGSPITQAQGSGPVHYMPPGPLVVTADAVLAAQGMLDPSKAEALIADEEKFQRPGFVDALKQRMQADVKSQEESIQNQIDELQKKLADLKKSNGNGGSPSSTAEKIHAAPKK